MPAVATGIGHLGDEMDLKNKLMIPYRVRAHTGDHLEIIADRHVPEDQVLMIDKDGHVHKFINVGRLIDLPAGDE